MARHTDIVPDDGSGSVTRIDASAYEAAAPEAASRIVIPDTEFLFSARFKKAGGDLILTGEDGAKLVVAGYFNQAKRPDLAAPGGAFLSGDLVERLAIPESPGQYAQVGAPAGAAVIGRVERLGGSATVQHANGVVEQLNIGDSIRQGDVVETGDSSMLGISFADGTAFNMGAGARMLISELVFDSSSTSNSAVFSIVKGAISFVAGQAAKTGEMRVETPIATVGIRGTSVNTKINTDVNGQIVSATYSLMQDPDGRIGAFNIINRVTGAIIASVTTTDNIFTLTPTAAGVDALSNPKTAQDIAEELANAQTLFPMFLSNPANFTPQPPQSPNPQPQTPGSPGSSTPPNDLLPPPPLQTPPIQQPDNHGGLEPGNGSSGGNGGGGTDTAGGGPPPPATDTTPPPVPVVIPGTNGQPTVAPDAAASHTFGEQPGISGSNTPGALGGTLTFADADLNDTHVATAQLVSGGVLWSGGADIPFASLLAISIAMTATVVADSTHAGSGSLIWNLNLPDHYLDFLGAGETLELTFAVGVQDNSGASATQQVKIIITGTNDVPVLTVAQPSVSLDEGSAIDIVGTHVSDPDVNDTLTVVLQVENGAISLAGNGDGLVSVEYLSDGSIRIVGSAAAVDAAIAAGVHYTPVDGFAGSDQLSIQVSDGHGGIQNQTVEIDVVPGSDRPQTNAATASIDEDADSSVTIHLTGSDSDGSVAAFRIIDIGGLHGTLYDASGNVLNAESLVTPSSGGTFSVYFVPDPDFSGDATFTFAAQDNDGQEDVSPATATITVNPVNDEPVLAAEIADQSTLEDALWSFQIPPGTFADVDSALSYTATLANGDPLPLWLTFDTQTQTFSGTPPEDFNGSLELSVTAEDGEYSVSDTFTVEIAPVNDAPTVAHLIPDQAAAEDTPWTFQVPADTFNDVDSATLTYAATLDNGDPLPSWLTFDAQTQTFSGTPPLGFNGQLDLRVTANDGEYSAHDTFSLGVSSGNPPPVLTYEPNPPPTLSEDNVTDSGVVFTVNDPGVTVQYDMTGWTPVIATIPEISEFEGHYYLYVALPTTWTGAREYVQNSFAELGGYLANITSAAENAFVHGLVGGTFAWIGATDSASEGTWVWADGPEAGQTLGYNSWWGAEPNNGGVSPSDPNPGEDYAFIDNNAAWTDVVDASPTPQGFVVEFSDFTWWQKVGNYGTAYFWSDAGVLTYALDNSSSAVQDLGSNDHVTDSFDIVAVDQTGQPESVTVDFEIDGADETNIAPETYDQEAYGDEDTTIYVSLYASDPDGSVAGFRITDTTGLNGTLYRDWSLTEVLHDGDVVNTSSGGSASVYFVPAEDFSGDTQFGVAAIDDDQAQDASPGVTTIHVSPVNEIPVLDLDTTAPGDGHATSVISASGDEVFISTSPSVVDPDNANLQSVTITLTNGEQGDQLISGDNPNLPGLNWEYLGEAGNSSDPLRIVFWGDAPLSVYQLAIEQISFSTDSPIGGDRHIEIVASDGNSDSAPVTSTVTVIGAMNLQVLTPTGYDLSTFYDGISDAGVAADHDEYGFLAIGETQPFAFRVHGYDFTYSGPSDDLNIDSGVITSIEILTDTLDVLAEASPFHIAVSDLGAALAQYNDSNGDDSTLLDALFRSMPIVANGDAGPDGLAGGRLADTLYGGDGDDVLQGGDSNDMLDGGAGFDRADYSDAEGSVTVNLNTGQGFGSGVGSDTLAGIEGVRGSDFNDTLIGNDGANVLQGGSGADTLTGGGGNDTFVFSLGDGHDTVTDFTVGQDKFDLTVGLDEAGLQALLTASPNSDTLTFADGSAITFSGLTLSMLNAQNDFVLHYAAMQ